MQQRRSLCLAAIALGPVSRREKKEGGRKERRRERDQQAHTHKHTHRDRQSDRDRDRGIEKQRI